MNKSVINIILCGLGGQGILYMTKVMATAALSKGLKVMGAETHGMAQRGGSVISHLRIGDVKSSLVRSNSADIVLSLDENESYRNLPFLKEGSSIYVNAKRNSYPRNEVKNFFKGKGISYDAIPAGEMAVELGAPMSTNLALLGFFSAFDKEPVSHNEMRDTIEKITPEKFREINLKIFDAGYNLK